MERAPRALFYVPLQQSWGVRLRTTARRQDNIVGWKCPSIVWRALPAPVVGAPARRDRDGVVRLRAKTVRRGSVRQGVDAREGMPGEISALDTASTGHRRTGQHRARRSRWIVRHEGAPGIGGTGHSARRPCGRAPRTRILTMRCRRRARGSRGYLARSLSRPVEGFPMLNRPLAPELRR